MKPLSFLALIAFVFLFSFTKGIAQMNNGSDHNKQKDLLEANRKVQDAIQTGDVAVLRKYISTDAIDHGGGENGADVKGEDIINMLANFHKDIDNLKFETLQDATNGEYIFALVHMTGTTNKPVFGMPAGTKLDNTSVDVVRVSNMQMIEHWNFMSAADMMKMMNSSGTND